MKAAFSLVLLAAVLPVSADDLVTHGVSRLRLRAQANVSAPPTTLADVLDFAQADPRLLREIGARPVEPNASGTACPVLTHDQVVRRLEQLGVNMARVLVAGPLNCRVRLVDSARGEPRPVDGVAVVVEGEAAPLLRECGSAGGRSLAEVLRAYVAREVSDLGGTPDIELEYAGQEFLNLTTPPWSFTVRSSAGEQLGLREFKVALRRDGRAQRTLHIGARVRLIKNALVADKPLAVGSFVRPEDLRRETRVFAGVSELGLERDEQVVGQQLKRFVAAGDLIRRGDLKAVDLVKRARPVTVVGAGENVHLRITGVALDSGSYGDVVRVRIGNSREDRRELRGVVTGMGTVRITEGVL
ncbi:MAG: flagellar basal body P-ring formation chaperone FlgA [Planctomycetes bacterium]|nr:flagellar basal body P-ring formation chaperone FlgA [Planctomycetota bacterium]